ncbi:2-oxo-4-hydroxy-4-carboxy-5-ureidoimidazoline decarboxylase [Rhodococcus sp. CH91]|uniref:2-oxo-4-hydroxy-4-carboxy-5-ureidoimidazoline decarboxylase n=1 Tax=Rhodococcus sp. CH91 TaxID=2910256 RepID=UPI001F4BACD1|nr:2-oxo-4-hydroxy-4-carboxy-5-ureidoimidazoline decarboxylase [Rhodococcus sp. CH91]
MQCTTDRFDAMSEKDAVALLLECCSSRAWAYSVAAARPFGTRTALLATAEAAAENLDGDDLAEALAGHPRIGERAEHPASRREQASVAEADADVLARLAAGNRMYEEKFGHVYLVRAAGRTATELLDILERRLGNDPLTEERDMRSALAEITRLRLERLIIEDGE